MTHLSVPGFWRLNRAKYGLLGSVCTGCGKIIFPPRSVCPLCGGSDFDQKQLSDSGHILSWTTIHVAPDGFESPYTIAVVRLDDGVVLAGQVVGDVGGLCGGSSVSVVFRKTGETDSGLLLYGYKFVLKKEN